MDERLDDLNLPVEDKININRITKKINILANNVQEYFDNRINISSDSLKNAYKSNNDLISILEKNKDLVREIQQSSYRIREKYQTNFNYESKDEIDEKINLVNIIEKTFQNRKGVVGIEEKENALNKKRKFLETRSKKRLKEFNESINILEKALKNEDILNPDTLEEDINMIKNIFDIKKINKSKINYLLPIIFFITSFILICVVIWKLMN